MLCHPWHHPPKLAYKYLPPPFISLKLIAKYMLRFWRSKHSPKVYSSAHFFHFVFKPSIHHILRYTQGLNPEALFLFNQASFILAYSLTTLLHLPKGCPNSFVYLKLYRTSDESFRRTFCKNRVSGLFLASFYSCLNRPFSKGFYTKHSLHLKALLISKYASWPLVIIGNFVH